VVSGSSSRDGRGGSAVAAEMRVGIATKLRRPKRVRANAPTQAVWFSQRELRWARELARPER